MTVGTILDMIDCKFHRYKGSLEVRNDKNFRILKSNPSKIRTNLHGVKLNNIL
jgi:hypothetical protein